MSLLTKSEIDEQIATTAGWDLEGDAIARSFDRHDFSGSVAFLQLILPIAEDMNHHPDVAISWKDVRLTISTHSEGGLTADDFELARRIDAAA